MAGERRGRPTVPPGGAGQRLARCYPSMSGAGRERIRQVAAPGHCSDRGDPAHDGHDREVAVVVGGYPSGGGVIA